MRSTRTDGRLRWGRALIVIVAAALLTLSWGVVAVIQGALAWGMRGEAKPVWFIALSYAVWLGPPLALVVAVGRFAVRRRSRSPGHPAP